MKQYMTMPFVCPPSTAALLYAPGEEEDEIELLKRMAQQDRSVRQCPRPVIGHRFATVGAGYLRSKSVCLFVSTFGDSEPVLPTSSTSQIVGAPAFIGAATVSS